jgi:hypothetical protein
MQLALVSTFYIISIYPKTENQKIPQKMFLAKAFLLADKTDFLLYHLTDQPFHITYSLE